MIKAFKKLCAPPSSTNNKQSTRNTVPTPKNRPNSINAFKRQGALPKPTKTNDKTCKSRTRAESATLGIRCLRVASCASTPRRLPSRMVFLCTNAYTRTPRCRCVVLTMLKIIIEIVILCMSLEVFPQLKDLRRFCTLLDLRSSLGAFCFLLPFYCLLFRLYLLHRVHFFFILQQTFQI